MILVKWNCRLCAGRFPQGSIKSQEYYIAAVALVMSFRLLPSNTEPCCRKCGCDTYAAAVQSRTRSRSQTQHKVTDSLTNLMGDGPGREFPLSFGRPSQFELQDIAPVAGGYNIGLSTPTKDR